MKSELAFIPNNNSHSIQLNDFIEQEANQENSSPKSSNSSIGHQEALPKDSEDISISHNQTNNQHAQKIANEINALEYHIQDKITLLDTPVNYFDKPIKYEFTPQVFPTEQQQLVEAITNQLNRIQIGQTKIYQSQLQFRHILTQQYKKPNLQRQVQQIKPINPIEEVKTNYSEESRDLQIIQHRYESNIALLSDQTKQLMNFYQYMIQEQEQKQLRKQVMTMQIHNHRARINLRNSSYTKRFNYISPIPKNNDKPLEFKSKFQVQRHQVDQLQDLVRKIHEEQAIWQQQQGRLNLLTKYYNITKAKKIINNQQNSNDFQYNSVLGKFTNREESVKYSQVIIDVPFTTTNQFNITPVSSFHGTNNFIKQSPIFKKGLASPQKKSSPAIKEAEITEPYQQYNLLKYKTQISRQMITEFEVYNLGRQKRIRDENRMIKKELEFIDEHIEHFDRSFAEEIRQYEEKGKPQINYQSFKTIQQETPYTKSPVSRDYYGNSRGSNNINIYRPDSINPSPLKSKRGLNKSLSQSKYIIKRQTPFNQSTKKDLTSNQNFLTQTDQISKKSDTVVSFFRDRVKSPSKIPSRQYCLYTNKKELTSNKKAPHMGYSSKQKINLTKSQKQLSPKNKNILRFNVKSQAQLCMTQKSMKNNQFRPSQKNQQISISTGKKIQSQG